MMGRLVERDLLAARNSRAKLKSAIKKVRGRRWRTLSEAMDAVALGTPARQDPARSGAGDS